MRVALIIAAAFVAGCSGYSQFFTAVPNATPEYIAKIRAAPPPAEPPVEHVSGNATSTVDAYEKRGYGLIGYSSFSAGGRQSDSGAREQGKKIGADLIVVMSPTYAGSVSGSMPITTPTSSTSYTTGSATAYGSGGSATAYGNSTTTTYGSQTQYVPYTIQRFNYGALYLIKRHMIMGVNIRALNDQERATLQTNKGVYVISVVDGTPAFREDILPGDIIVSIDGDATYAEAFSDSLRKKAGQKVDVSIIRNNATLTKSIKLNN